MIIDSRRGQAHLLTPEDELFTWRVSGWGKASQWIGEELYQEYSSVVVYGSIQRITLESMVSGSE